MSPLQLTVIHIDSAFLLFTALTDVHVFFHIIRIRFCGDANDNITCAHTIIIVFGDKRCSNSGGGLIMRNHWHRRRCHGGGLIRNGRHSSGSGSLVAVIHRNRTFIPLTAFTDIRGEFHVFWIRFSGYTNYNTTFAYRIVTVGTCGGRDEYRSSCHCSSLLGKGCHSSGSDRSSGRFVAVVHRKSAPILLAAFTYIQGFYAHWIRLCRDTNNNITAAHWIVIVCSHGWGRGHGGSGAGSLGSTPAIII